MRFLGVTAGPDGGAALVVDGVLVAAVQERRFPGGATATLPRRATHWCLERAGGAAGLDGVAVVASRGRTGIAPIAAVTGGDPMVVPELFALAVYTLHVNEPDVSAVLVVDAAAGRALIARGDRPHLTILDEVHGAPLPALPDLATEACHRAGTRVLNLAGSAARDIAMTSWLRASGRFAAVHVPPAPHGCGAAVGAALAIAAQHGEGLRPVDHAYLGPSPDAVLDMPGLHRTRAPDVASAVAELLVAGRTVGWVQGAAEFATLPLGHRAVLARPDQAQLLGSTAPVVAAVPAERAGDWFRTGPSRADRCAGLGHPARTSRIPHLTGVLDDNGIAAVHAVGWREVPLLHETLCRFAARTGVPVLRATGLPDDPWSALARAEIDVVVVGDAVVERAATLPARHLALSVRA